MTVSSTLMKGKRGLVMGVANDHSIAYGIAKACHREGAELAFTYVGERFKDRITEFAKRLEALHVNVTVRRNRGTLCPTPLPPAGEGLSERERRHYPKQQTSYFGGITGNNRYVSLPPPECTVLTPPWL